MTALALALGLLALVLGAIIWSNAKGVTQGKQQASVASTAQTTEDDRAYLNALSNAPRNWQQTAARLTDPSVAL